MRKPFVSTDPSNHQGNNICFTPKEIVDSLGPFDMDVCTVSYRPFDIATKHIEFDKGQDSLKINWEGFVWMNPPYGKEIEPFIQKFKEHYHGIALVFARMGTPWMQDWVASGGGIFFLRKRICFVKSDGTRIGTNAGADSCLLFQDLEAKIRIKNSGMAGVFNQQ